MAGGLHDTGEEYYQDQVVASYDVGLYHDGDVSGDTTAGDQLTEGDDIGAITTEPGDNTSNYARQNESFVATDVSGDWVLENDTKVTFDVSDQSTSQTVDAGFVVVNYQSDDTGDSSANDHLLFTFDLSQSVDIGNVNTVEVSANTVRGKF